MRYVEFLRIYLLLLLLFFLNCSDEGTNPDDVKFIIPENDISFVEHIQPMFELRCGLDSGCHSSLDDNRLTYIELINNHSLQDHKLVTGEKLVELTIHLEHPELAPLYLILLEGYPDSPDDRMPPYLTNLPLTDDQIDGVRRWIGEGAKD